ncbi:MAG: ATP-binding protein [Coprobacillus sp.]|nr:ATP-binding protein [Coprobacillus sp.]
MEQMVIKRDYYLNKLIHNMNNNFVKVVTGIRRSGKSYLLNKLFRDYLLSSGVSDDHIIRISLDTASNEELLDRKKLYQFVMDKIKDKEIYYLILDEIQNVEGFENLLLDFLYNEQIDVYVTGSNSKFLSSDIITEFRGRSKNIHVLPLSYSEFSDFKGSNDERTLNEYMRYGGLPEVVLAPTSEDKEELLDSFFSLTYVRDIIDRYKIRRRDVLDEIIDIIASNIGSLTNPLKIYNTYTSKGDKNISLNTIELYLSYLENAYIVSRVKRYDIGSRKTISGPSKYYFSDLGLRNSRLSYEDNEPNHLMENAVYNEMIKRGYKVCIGVVPNWEKNTYKALEVDFLCTKGNKKYYIQVSQNIENSETREREFKPLYMVDDSYKKILILNEDILPYNDEKGVSVFSIKDFLFDESLLNY